MSIGREVFQQSFDVSRETLDKLSAYEALVRKWNPAINLVSAKTLDDLWVRHFADSAQLWSYRPTEWESWADFGSGGGFPGVVLAILAAERDARLGFSFVESDRRKAAFLMTVARELALNVDVISARIEKIPSLAADVISARALAPLVDLLTFAEPHLNDGGTLLFPKGARWREEVAAAKENWAFSLSVENSITDENAAVLILKEVSRV